MYLGNINIIIFLKKYYYLDKINISYKDFIFKRIFEFNIFYIMEKSEIKNALYIR